MLPDAVVEDQLLGRDGGGGVMLRVLSDGCGGGERLGSMMREGDGGGKHVGVGRSGWRRCEWASI